MAPQPDRTRRVLHPRDLVCPRCGADVDHPCSFSGRIQKEVHCTERLLALGDPGLRVEAAPEAAPEPPPASQPANKTPAPDPPKKKRPLPSAPSRRKAAAPVEDAAPLTLFG